MFVSLWRHVLVPNKSTDFVPVHSLSIASFLSFLLSDGVGKTIADLFYCSNERTALNPWHYSYLENFVAVLDCIKTRFLRNSVQGCRGIDYLHQCHCRPGEAGLLFDLC